MTTLISHQYNDINRINKPIPKVNIILYQELKE